MIQRNIKGLTIVLLVNLFAFLVHSSLRDTNLENTYLVLNLSVSYFINTIAVIALCISLLFLNRMFKSQIGFIYLALSVFKMMILYGFLNPTNIEGGVVTNDALAFLVPFAINLIMELFYVIKLLKINDLVTYFEK